MALSLFVVFIIYLITFGYEDYKKHLVLKTFYKSLPYKNYYLNQDQVYINTMYEKHEWFTWFLDNNDFQIACGVFLHYNTSLFFHPFSYYWLRKYRKWFKENINPNTLKLFNPNPNEQIGKQS